MFGIEKCRYFGKITDKSEMVELTGPTKKEGEDHEAMRDLVMMAMDLLNNIILGLIHGDSARNKFISKKILTRFIQFAKLFLFKWLTVLLLPSFSF